MLAQYSQDQRCTTKPLDIPVANIEIKQGTVKAQSRALGLHNTSLILKQLNCLSMFWLGFIVLLILFICTSLNEVKMVNSCKAIGFTNHAKPGSRISFHAFPYKNSELL